MNHVSVAKVQIISCIASCFFAFLRLFHLIIYVGLSVAVSLSIQRLADVNFNILPLSASTTPKCTCQNGFDSKRLFSQ